MLMKFYQECIYIYMENNAPQTTQIMSHFINTGEGVPLYLLRHEVCLSKESHPRPPQKKRESQ